MWDGIEVDGLKGLRSRWFGVDGAKVAVVVIGGSGGGLGRASLQARQYADAGISALAVGCHGFGGRPALANIALERFAEATAWIHGQARTATIVLHGSSRGNEAALLTAALVDQSVAAVVALVPGNVVLCSWPPGQPAWTLAGEPLPYVGSFGPSSSRPDAYIPVEDIPGPLFLVGAGMDAVWPSAAMVDAISERRKSHGHHHDVVLQYSDAGHELGLLGTRNSSLHQAPSDFFAADLRADAWHRLLNFLDFLPPSGDFA